MSRLGCLLGIALLLLLFGASCSDSSSGFGVDLTMEIGPSVTDDALGEITGLTLHVTGDEKFTTTVAFGRPVQRTERLLYRPNSASRAIDISGDLIDENGVTIAHGDTNSINLRAENIVSAQLNFSAGTGDGGVDGGIVADGGTMEGGVSTDLSHLDLSHADLSSSDLADEYEATVLADTPLAYYRFDENSGTTAHDVTGHGNDGTYFGSFTLGNAGALFNDTDTAASFAGTVGGVEVSHAFLTTTGNLPWTVEMWISPAQIPTDGIWLWDLDQGSQWIHSFINPTLKLQVERTDTDGNNIGIDADTPPIGSYTYVVVTYDGTTITIYEQGLFSNSTNTATGPAQDLSAAFYIGAADQSSGAFDGSIDEVAIYDYALSGQQIGKHYAAGSK